MVAERILLVGGKGGTGKTTVVISLALHWAKKGKNVGILDANLSSPDVPFYLGLPTQGVEALSKGVEPLRPAEGFEVLSVGLFLNNPLTPVSWRGPIRHAVLRQFLQNARWGELDILLIDLPPGISEEHMTLSHLLSGRAFVLLVSDSSRLSLMEAKRLSTFFGHCKIAPIGVVLNKERRKRPRHSDLEILATLPFDQHLARASRREGALLLGKPAEAFTNALRFLARRCLKAMQEGPRRSLTLQARLLFKGG